MNCFAIVPAADSRFPACPDVLDYAALQLLRDQRSVILSTVVQPCCGQNITFSAGLKSSHAAARWVTSSSSQLGSYSHA